MNKNRIFQYKERGAALLIFVVMFVAVSLSFILTIGHGVYEDYATFKAFFDGTRSYYAAEAGIEDAIHRHRDGDAYSNSETFMLGGVTVMTTRTVQNGVSYTIISEGHAQSAVRKSAVVLEIGNGASFNFGLQSGNGGIALSNNSKIRGNVFSNGTVLGQGSATAYGDVISAGSTGRIEHIHATGTARAHTIVDSNIGKDVYCNTVDNSNVGGLVYCNTALATTNPLPTPDFPGPADEIPQPLPIPDSQINDWKTGIVNTGTVIPSTDARCAGGTYIIDSNTRLGNVKIECNVEIRKKGSGTTVIIDNPVWISGNLTFSQGPTIVASSSLGARSVQIIVDKENNRLTSSKISVNQSTQFNSGSPSSYVLLLSMNNSAENSGTEKAIDLAQSANGKVLVYASHGLVDMGNSISLKEVTAHQINISNGAEVIYESGLMNLLFTSGPGGGFTISSWQEV